MEMLPEARRKRKACGYQLPQASKNTRYGSPVIPAKGSGCGSVSLTSTYTARLIALSLPVTSSSTDTRIVPRIAITFSNAIRENIVDLREKNYGFIVSHPPHPVNGFFTLAENFGHMHTTRNKIPRFLSILPTSILTASDRKKKIACFFDFFSKRV
jgi:hypothetical protein